MNPELLCIRSTISWICANISAVDIKIYLQYTAESLDDEDQCKAKSSKKYTDPSGINGALARRQVLLEEPADDILASYRC